MFGVAARTCCSVERHGVNVLHLQYYLHKSIPNPHVCPSLEILLISLVHLIERTFRPEASFFFYVNKSFVFSNRFIFFYCT
jgi:hypothetical protein